MSNYFKSIFGKELDLFVEYKRSLGFKYETEISRLKYIDNRLTSLNLFSKEISSDTFDYLTQRNGMKEAHYARQYGVIKDFCKFLISLEFSHITFKEKKFNIINNYVPTLFNSDDIHLLFEQCDLLLMQHKNDTFYRLYYGYSILFRLLYSSGLRISEALKIRTMNINIEERTIEILDSKRHTSRIIVISKSMSKCLFDYMTSFNLEKNDILFINTKGNDLSYERVRLFFKKLLFDTSLDSNSHLHDLRHVFTNNALDQMLAYGYDENTVIVYLYKYLGHKSITETEYYIHMTDSHRNKIIEKSSTLSKKLYERVNFDE